MHDLAGRLDAVDPVAAQAIRVFRHFDQLTAAGVGLLSLLRSTAELAQCPVGLVHPGRVVPLVVSADGRETDAPVVPADAVPVPGAKGAFIWLERSGAPNPADPYVTDRLAAAVSTVLSRTTTSFASNDVAFVEILVDRARSTEVRHSAAARLGLTAAPVAVVVTLAGDGPLPRRSARLGSLQVELRAAGSSTPPHPLAARAAWATAPSLVELPLALEDARAALRLTAAPGELGATQLSAEDLGALTVVAQAVDSPAAQREVHLVDEAVAPRPWAESTIIAIATCDSLRAAAALLGVHHSTLQQRIAVLGRHLHFSVDTPAGQLRAYLAVMLRRAHLNNW